MCKLADLTPDEGLRLNTSPPVTIFLSEGDVYCLDDTCTHDTYSLAEGWVEKCVVECPLHFAKFDLRTGAVVSPPAHAPVSTHELRVDSRRWGSQASRAANPFLDLANILVAGDFANR